MENELILEEEEEEINNLESKNSKTYNELSIDELNTNDLINKQEDLNEKVELEYRISSINDEENSEELNINNVPKKEKKYWNIILVVICCFFIVVATILGTGILALPLKLVDCGFFPFVTTFLFCTLAQSLTLIYMIELLQRTQVIMNLNKTKSLNKFLSEGPDLHYMVVLHFVSVLVSYALAGPLAYQQLIHIITNYTFNLNIIIIVFVISLVLIIVFGGKLVASIISLLTFLKGTLLIVMIGLISYAGIVINRNSSTNFQYIGRPFLIGTVALGGAINTLPIIYSKMKPTLRNIRIFRIAAVSALITCAILNVLWCFFFLKIVPQKSTSSNPENSLEYAVENGLTSAQVLVNVLAKDYPSLVWIGDLVAIFVSISITVSFMALGSGLKHMLDGYIKSIHELSNNKSSKVFMIVNKLKLFKINLFNREIRIFPNPIVIIQFLQYILWFTIILIIANLNPQGFLSTLEIFTSLALNLESGFFVAVMLWTSTRKKNIKGEIPCALPNWMIHTIWFTASYFLFACIYDIIITILGLIFKYIIKSKIPI